MHYNRGKDYKALKEIFDELDCPYWLTLSEEDKSVPQRENLEEDELSGF